MSKSSDEKFKEFIGENYLETSSENEIVDVKYIGKFKLFTHDHTKYISLHSIKDVGIMVSLSTTTGIKKLMKFLRHIFKSQTKIKSDKYIENVLDSLNDNREDSRQSVTIAQNLARGAKYDENTK